MNANTEIDPVKLCAFLAGDTPLGQAQIDALTAEIQSDPMGRGYAGKTLDEVLALLSLPFDGPNPTPEPDPAPRVFCRPDEFVALAAKVRSRLILAPSLPAEASVLAELIDKVAPLMAMMQSVDISEGSDTLTQIQGLVSLGLLSDAEARVVTHQRDEYYRPTVQHQPRSYTLFGAGKQLTLADLAVAGVPA